MNWARSRSRRRSSAPASRRTRVSEVIMGQILTAGAGPEPGPPGLDRRRHPGREPGLGRQPAVRLRPARGRARLSGDPQRRRRDRRRRRPGIDEHGAALRASAQRREDGRLRDDRHHDQGRPVGRLQRLSHGQHGRERRHASGRSPAQQQDEFAVGSQNKAEAAQKAGRFKDEIVPVTVKTPQGRHRRRHRRISQARHDARRRSASCAPPSTRKAPSPPAMPPASMTAPPRWC